MLEFDPNNEWDYAKPPIPSDPFAVIDLLIQRVNQIEEKLNEHEKLFTTVITELHLLKNPDFYTKKSDLSDLSDPNIYGHTIPE